MSLGQLISVKIALELELLVCPVEESNCSGSLELRAQEIPGSQLHLHQ